MLGGWCATWEGVVSRWWDDDMLGCVFYIITWNEAFHTTVTYLLCSVFCTWTHCSTCSSVLLLRTCLCVSAGGVAGALWYVPAAIPLGSRMGLGVETRPFLVQTLEGSMEAARDGALDGTLDTGAEADMWFACGRADGVGLEGSEVCVSISRPVHARGCSNMLVTGESFWKLECALLSWHMGSRRTSWTTGRVASESVVLVLWWFTWFVCGTACCCIMLNFSNLSDGLWRGERI